TGKPFTVSMIHWLRYKHRIPAPSSPAGTLAVSQVRARYGVSLWVVHYWIERGIVAAAQRKRNAPYAITIDDNVDRRLRKWVASSAHLHPSIPPTQTAAGPLSPERRHAERTPARPRLRINRPPHRPRPVPLRDEFLTQAHQPRLQSRRLDPREAHLVHAGRARIRSGQRIGMAQDVLTADLVVKHIETELG